MKRIGIVMMAVLAFAACQIGTDPDVSSFDPETDTDVLAAEEAFSFTYDQLLAQGVAQVAESTTSALSESGITTSATAPIKDSDTTVTWSDADTNGLSFNNYPYPDWMTTVAVDPHPTEANIYKIVSTSTAPGNRGFLEREVVETYYIQDANTDGTWQASTDYIVNPSTPGSASPLYRETFTEEFKDGSAREVVIAGSMSSDPDSYIGNTSYGFAPILAPAININTYDLSADWSQPAQADNSNQAVWSSVVMYEHPLNETFNFWFWNESVTNPVIYGTRYYAEHYVDASNNILPASSAPFDLTTTTAPTLVATSISFENILAEIGTSNTLVGTNVIVQRTAFEMVDTNTDDLLEAGEVGSATSTELVMQFLLDGGNFGETIQVEKGNSGKTREVQLTQKALDQMVTDVVPIGNWADVQALFN